MSTQEGLPVPPSGWRRTTSKVKVGPNLVGVTWTQLISTGVSATNRVKIRPKNGRRLTVFTQSTLRTGNCEIAEIGWVHCGLSLYGFKTDRYAAGDFNWGNRDPLTVFRIYNDYDSE